MKWPPVRPPDRSYFSTLKDDCSSPLPSDMSLTAQDETELAKGEAQAECYDAISTDTSDSEYDPDRPYSLWENYCHNVAMAPLIPSAARRIWRQTAKLTTSHTASITL
eukprot:1790522-Pleurochrysis_carterae.AAC.1